MVVIINGEIVPDNDPRARKLRGQDTATSSSRQRSFGANVRTVGDSSHTSTGGANVSNKAWGRGNSVSGSAAAMGADQPAPQNPLDQVAIFLGLHGKTAKAPAFMGVPETPIPLINIALVILVGIVFRNYLIPVLAVIGFYGFQYSKLNRQ